MRIHRLILRHWRGVVESDVTFADGVTIIEGPNEIGKSSIVQAVTTLFNEMDSSRKKTIQAIKPVDNDVGSEVCAEISAGPYRFTYGKTFNKTPSTQLEITSPDARHFTGREAHEKVLDLLSESVDMALWQALLIEQGMSLKSAELIGSSHLLKALDEAAGSTGHGDENLDLFARVQAEYEQYFSLKTGKLRYQKHLDALDHARSELTSATQRLAELDEQIEQQALHQQEVNRLRTLLPKQQEDYAQQEQRWRSAQGKQQALENERSKLLPARQLAKQLQGQLDNRRRETADLKKARADLESRQHALQPQHEAIAPLVLRVEALRDKIGQSTSDLKQAREHVRTTDSDLAHLRTQQQQETEVKRLEDLRKVSEKLAGTIDELSKHVVTDALSQAFQQAELDHQFARSQLDNAAAKVHIEAISDASIAINGDPVKLTQGQQHSSSTSQSMSIEFPEIARITIAPPATSKEIKDQLSDAQSRLKELQSQCCVETAAQAAAANTQRQHLEQAIAQLKAQEQLLAGAESLAELVQQVATRQQKIDRYIANRQSNDTLPATVEQAEHAAETAQETRNMYEETLETLNARLAASEDDMQRAQHDQARQLQQIQVQEATLASAQKALDQRRADESDGALEDRFNQAAQQRLERERRVAALEADIDAQSINTAQSLAENASAVLAQTRTQLAQSEQFLAVANDRLITARADGRFETFEAAQRKSRQKESEVDALQRRASAAKLLWDTLNQCRDATRQAYIEPLKHAVEQLGQIVFGPSFSVHVDESWQISERTLDGKTIPLSSLSVGAQEQLSLLGRLAAAQLVSRREGVPLIIDDALGFSDPQRLKTLGAAIAAAGKKCQIIILTCTPGRFQNVGGAKFVTLGA
ncbi:MAG: hypothetical protein AB8B96_18325 [Lysobacterales bacterium]